jgi:hypothetical protein
MKFEGTDGLDVLPPFNQDKDLFFEVAPGETKTITLRVGIKRSHSHYKTYQYVLFDHETLLKIARDSEMKVQRGTYEIWVSKADHDGGAILLFENKTTDKIIHEQLEF